MHEDILTVKRVISPWDKKYYIGFLLDAINLYLGGDYSYFLNVDGKLHEVSSAIMMKENKSISIDRIINDNGIPTDDYIINGFPDDKFEGFKKEAQGILEMMLDQSDYSI